MIRTALDSDQLDAFTTNTDFILTYSDLVPVPAAFETLHPGQQVVYIDRGLGDPGTKATIADVEKGALTPADLPGWYDTRHAAGLRFLTMYVNRDTLAAANAAVGARQFWHWIATLDGTLVVPDWKPLTGPALVQFAGEQTTGIHADLSLVLNPDWRPAPAAALPGWVAAAVGSISGRLSALAQDVDAIRAILATLT